jgi:hypothetical protein
MFYTHMSDNEVIVDNLVLGKEYLVKEFGLKHTLISAYMGTCHKRYGNMVDLVNIREIIGFSLKETEIPDFRRILMVPSCEHRYYSKVYHPPTFALTQE